MAILTYDATTRVLAAAPTTESVISKIVDTAKVFTLEANQVLDASGAFYAGVTLAALGFTGGGIVARKRQAEGKQAVLGFLG